MLQVACVYLHTGEQANMLWHVYIYILGSKLTCFRLHVYIYILGS